MKSFSTFFAVVIGMYTSISFAQGTWTSVGPYGGWINDLAEDNNGRLLAATSFGGIYRSADNAESWQQIYNDTLIFDPRSIAVNSSGHIFVGSEGINGVGLLRSTDDGATWEVLNTGLQLINDLLVADTGEIFACTFDDGLFHSTNNGITFSLVSSLPASYPTDVEVNMSGHLFVGTQFDAAYIYRSTDNGTSWQPINNGISSSIVDIFASPTGEIYATDQIRVYMSTNNGDSWTDLMAPTGASYGAVMASSTGDIYVGASIGVFRTTDDGSTWTQETGLPASYVSRLLGTEDGMLFAGGTGPGVYRRTGLSAAGSDWEQKVNGMANTFITSITQDITTGYVYAGTRHQLVFRSTNLGLTWESSASGIPEYEWIYDVAVNVDGTVFVSGAYGAIYRSIDQGSTWTNIYSISATTIGCNVQGHVFAGYGNFVYRSTNNGDSWTSSSLSTVQYIADIAFDGNTVYVATGTPFGFGSQGVYRSTDNGSSWGAFNDGLTTLNVYAVAVADSAIAADKFASPGDRISCGTNDGTKSLDESNNRWGNSGLEGTTITYLKYMVHPDIDLIAVASAFLYARDQTSFWNVITLLADGDYSCIEYAQLVHGPPTSSTGEEYAILLGTNGYGIYRGTDITLSVVSDHEIPQSFSLAQNYPNPFNPKTKIGFGMKDVGFVSLKVYDLLGREVATLVNEKKAPGTYEVTWDASRQSSGVYFYRLVAGNFVETKKLVLLR